MREERKIPLIEMFGPTIQGEGSMCGKQTMFIRFGTCDYKCGMCDSMHSVDPIEVKKNATYTTPTDIAKQMIKMNKEFDCPWVTLTGGNPCLWPLENMIKMLQEAGMKIALETQGTFKPDWVDYCDLVTVSPKGPGMLAEETNFSLLDAYMDNTVIPRATEEAVLGEGCLKIVIFDEEDLEYARQIWRRYPEVDLYLSLGNPWLPGNDIDPNDHIRGLLHRYHRLADKLYADKELNKAIFLPQLHTLIYSNDLGR